MAVSNVRTEKYFLNLLIHAQQPLLGVRDPLSVMLEFKFQLSHSIFSGAKFDRQMICCNKGAFASLSRERGRFPQAGNNGLPRPVNRICVIWQSFLRSMRERDNVLWSTIEAINHCRYPVCVNVITRSIANSKDMVNRSLRMVNPSRRALVECRLSPWFKDVPLIFEIEKRNTGEDD
jgi:hypothetical protein